MPRLLQITVTRNQGSTGKISEQIALMMKSQGWDVEVAHGARYVNPSAVPSYQIQSVRGEYFHALKSLLLDADGLGSERVTRKLVEHIRQMKPDVIHLHNLHGYYINYPVLFDYLNSTDIPVVMTLHDCWSFTGHCIHFVTADCDKWKTWCHDCPLTHSVPKSLFLDASQRNYGLKKKYIAANRNLHIVCASDWLQQFVGQSMYSATDIRTIHNGIDLDVYRPVAEKRTDRFLILGVANPWSRDKGLYDIYRLRELLSEAEYDIILVGLTRKQLAQLPHGIKGMERTSDQEELVRLYSESHVLLNLTYADTFPTINLEALACGTPVVTYRTGGSPESLDENTGIVVEQGDVEAARDAVVMMKRQPFSSVECRKKAEKFFDKDKQFLEYASLYNSLIGK